MLSPQKALDLKDLLTHTLDNNYIIDNMIKIIDDMLDGKISLEMQLGSFCTVGELIHIQGFYAMPWAIQQLASTMIGQTIHICIMGLGLNPLDPDVGTIAFECVKHSQSKEEDITVTALSILTKKYGVPVVQDTQKMEAIKARHADLVKQIITQHEPFIKQVINTITIKTNKEE